MGGVWCAQGPTVSPSCAGRSRGSELCGVCVSGRGAGGCALLSLSLSRLVREHWGQTVLSACGAQERRWRSTRTSWGWRPGYVFAGARGRRWADTCRAGSRPPWWTRGWDPTRGLVETPWNTRKRASRGRRLARSAAGARGLPAAARLVCARPARSVAVGASWLCRERPGPVTAERLDQRPRAHFPSRVLWVSTYTERDLSESSRSAGLACVRDSTSASAHSLTHSLTHSLSVVWRDNGQR